MKKYLSLQKLSRGLFMAFDASAQFYDVVYESKDYAGEIRLVSKIIDSRLNSISRILDVGCGTGTHSILLAEQYPCDILAIDSSPKMIEKAKEKASSEKLSLEFRILSIEQISKITSKFDVVIALFHVVNYLPDSNSLLLFIKSCSTLLNSNGILIFDMWNGKLCTGERFEEKQTSFQYQEQHWRRISTPVLNEEEGKVQIKHSYYIDKSTEMEFYEIHNLSFWTVQDVVRLAYNDFQHIEVLESDIGDYFDEKIHWSPLFIMQNRVSH